MQRRSLLLAGGLVASTALIVWPALSPAQSPPVMATDVPSVKCNMTSDTTPRGSATPTPVTKDLLTSGLPCQQLVNTTGMFQNRPLDNLQRGFDFYSWLTFIALNSPADGKTIGEAGPDARTIWEDHRNYRQLADIMLPNAAKPDWNKAPDRPAACVGKGGPNDLIVHLEEEAFNQPFKSGPLIDQSGSYALFDILMNKPMFDFIANNDLYNRQKQAAFPKPIDFPEGTNTPPTEAKVGAIMLKVSWKILDPAKDNPADFHTVDALIYFPGEPDTRAGPDCVPKKLGLIGFHAGHKTASAKQWVWTTFEHVKNVPDEREVKAGTLQPPYHFYNPNCPQCEVNVTPADQPWDPDTSLKFKGDYRSQVVREKMVPSFVLKEVADLNKPFREILKGTVWENYVLLATQWPSDNKSKTDPLGAPAPTYLANTTLETYSQGKTPLASSSCMACHGNATTHHVPATASDFTFILEKAQ